MVSGELCCRDWGLSVVMLSVVVFCVPFLVSLLGAGDSVDGFGVVCVLIAVLSSGVVFMCRPSSLHVQGEEVVWRRGGRTMRCPVSSPTQLLVLRQANEGVMSLCLSCQQRVLVVSSHVDCSSLCRSMLCNQDMTGLSGEMSYERASHVLGTIERGEGSILSLPAVGSWAVLFGSFVWGVVVWWVTDFGLSFQAACFPVLVFLYGVWFQGIVWRERLDVEIVGDDICLSSGWLWSVRGIRGSMDEVELCYQELPVVGGESVYMICARRGAQTFVYATQGAERGDRLCRVMCGD